MARAILLMTLMFAAAPARAGHSIGADLTLASVDLPPYSPGGDLGRSTYLSVGLNGEIELLEDRLLLDLSLSRLQDEASQPAWQSGLGLEYLPNDHWTLGVVLSATPKRDAVFDDTILPRWNGIALEEAPVTYRTHDWSGGLTFTGSYDTLGDSNFETAFDCILGSTRYSIAQELLLGDNLKQRIINAGGNPEPVLRSSLRQLKLGLGITETFFHDTDLGLRGTLYLYDRDPYLVGTWRARRGALTVEGGAGLALAPPRWELRPSLTHRFGRRFSLRLSFSGGRYYDGGTTGGLMLKATVKPTSSLRLFASATLQTDRDLPGTEKLVSRFLGIGTSYYF